MAFKCKQFSIEDSLCAMKVGTDSLMLGSWAKVNQARNILDIGTGSGLLAIMLAQKSLESCQIEGIDIDQDAINQAKQNAQRCPWSQKLHFHHVSLQAQVANTLYDVIISNPPYFTENLTANHINHQSNRQQARQTLTLEHQTLLQHVIIKLTKQGRFYCVLPAENAGNVCEYADSLGLFWQNKLEICTKPQAKVSRVLIEFSKQQVTQSTQQITIQNSIGEYSADYVSLCKDYYLNF